MRLFKCQSCEQIVLFENTRCERCGHRLAFVPERGILSALEPDGASDGWTVLALPGEPSRTLCANAAHDACNWLVDPQHGFAAAPSPAAAGIGSTPAPDGPFCQACRHNRTIPDISVPDNLARWRLLEWAKHRLFYTLLALKLPTPDRTEDAEHGLAFDFLADPPDDSAPKVMTGHDEGLITLALAEADPARREALRQQMGETYRTLLGHFRHEVGHYYWNVLVRDASASAADAGPTSPIERFRALFGDERRDYAEALAAHYANPPPPDWSEHFISTYATAHPWEDWAETWAHYLHIVDTLDTARAYGLHVDPPIDDTGSLESEVAFDPYGRGPMKRLVDAWVPLTLAVNSLNRSMGQPDLYPFVLSPGVVEKLAFVHELVHEARPASGPTAARAVVTPANGVTTPMPAPA